MINIKNTLLIKLIYLYITIPILVMICGFSKLWFSAVTLICFGYIGYKTFTKERAVKEYSLCKRDLIIMIVLIATLFIWFGNLGLTLQSGDWNKHNAVLRDLIHYRWPVIYKNGGHNSFLTYYCAQYMLPALIAKIFGSNFYIGAICLFVQNVFGLAIIIFYLPFLLENKNIYKCAFTFLFIGNLIIFAQIILYNFIHTYPGLSYIPYAIKYCIGYDWITISNTNTLMNYQYSLGLSLISWNIPFATSWMVAALLLGEDISIDEYVVFGLPLILHGAFPFIGVVLLMAYYAFRKISTILKALSIQNILALITVGTFSFLYFIGYFLEEKPAVVGFSSNIPHDAIHWIILILFEIFAFMIMGVFSIKNEKYRYVSIYCYVLLIFIPFIHSGVWNDFVMRASIPLIFCLNISFINLFFKQRGKIKIVMTILYICSSFYPTLLVLNWQNNYNIGEKHMNDNYYTMYNFSNPDPIKDVDSIEKYETYDYNGKKVSEVFTGVDNFYNYFTHDDNMKYFIRTIGKTHE